MTEERITEVHSPDGDTHTTHTVITDGERRGGGSGWLIAIVLVIAESAGIWLYRSLTVHDAN